MPNYLILVDGGSRVHVLEAAFSGPSSVALRYLLQPTRAQWVRGRGADLDRRTPIGPVLAVADPMEGLELWSVQSPSSPALVARIPTTGQRPNAVCLQWPYLWAGVQYATSTGTAWLFDVSNPYQPINLGEELWLGTQPWNSVPYAGNHQAEIPPDLSVLLLSRRSQWQRYSLAPAAYQPPPMLDTSTRIDDPQVKRATASATFGWSGGGPYYALCTGNQVQLAKHRAGQAPQVVSESRWRVTPAGDRDYNVFNLSVADGCRYLFAGCESSGSVLADLGDGMQPSMGQHRYRPGAEQVGGMVFRRGATDYLISHGWGDQTGTWLYKIESLDDLRPLCRVVNGAGAPITVNGGYYLP